LFAVLLAGGACFTIWRFFQGNGALPNAIYSLAALGFAAWFAWFAVHDSALGRRMSAASDGAFPFYLGCAVMLGLSSFAGYLCVHGFSDGPGANFQSLPFPLVQSRGASGHVLGIHHLPRVARHRTSAFHSAGHALQVQTRQKMENSRPADVKYLVETVAYQDIQAPTRKSSTRDPQ
jgi:hypothetical protein